MAMAKIKIGDKVKVIAGVSKGKTGEVIAVDREKNTVTVKGVKMITKHQKATRNQKAEIIEREAPIHISNVMYIHDGRPTRIGIKVLGDKDGKVEKTRYAKSTGDNI